MDNKYLYLSSKDSNNHSDWTCQFSNPIKITPYSQVRLISAHINAQNNKINVTDDNKTLWVGFDYWNKLNSVIPLLPVRIAKKSYEIGSKLVKEIEEEIEMALIPYCYLRGGISVTIDADKKWTLKCSGMEIYGCPTIQLTDAVVEHWSKLTTKETILKSIGDGTQVLLNKCRPVTANVGSTDYYGLALPNDDGRSYFFSNEMVTGLTGATSSNKHVNAVINFDLRSIDFESGDYISAWSGQCNEDGFTKEGHDFTWGYKVTTDPNSFNTAHRYCIQFEQTRMLVIYTIVSNGGITPRAFIYEQADGYDPRKVYRLTHQEWDTEYGSHFQLDVVESDTGLEGSFTDLMDEEGQQNIRTQRRTLTAKNVTNEYYEAQNMGFVINTEDFINKITFTCAIDDDQEEKYGFNKTTGSFGERSSLESDINRPITIIENISDVEGNELEIPDNIFEIMERETLYTSTDTPLYGYELTEGYSPNAVWAGISGDGAQISSKTDTDEYLTYTQGLTSEYAFNPNAVSFPQAYLEIKDFPLNNYTANYLEGKLQKFISPIDFYPGGSDEANKYTSKVYTEQFMTLSNSSTMTLSSLRVRICDINGSAMPLDEYTIVTVEVRDNPYLKQMKQNEMLIKGIVDKFQLPQNQTPSNTGF